MKTYTQKLEGFYDLFEAYQDYDFGEFDALVDEFNEYYDNHCDRFDEKHDRLYGMAYDMMDVGAVYFQAIAHEEQLQTEREERAYLTSEWNH